ncbi:histone-lysine N-methyltransferase SETMAR-like [Macrobrachium rosenbergii]|uniref:histone-lysine N-methyltransferase SETMAR-like n=1 Tax=Macrobrachium rosenbergii TaxID=79674 RepID=UPI0034D5738A
MLKEAYGDEQMSQVSFYQWFNRFSDGNEQVEDEPRSGAPKSACKEENIEEVQRLVMQDRRISVRMLSEAGGISIGTVETVLTEDLKLHKVCAKFVPKILSDDQRQFRVECCTDILEMIEADSGFLNKVVTCDESWVLTYDPEGKRQSAQWKHATSPRPKKAKMSRSQEKAMVIPFFDSQGLIHIAWVPQVYDSYRNRSENTNDDDSQCDSRSAAQQERLRSTDRQGSAINIILQLQGAIGREYLQFQKYSKKLLCYREPDSLLFQT